MGVCEYVVVIEESVVVTPLGNGEQLEDNPSQAKDCFICLRFTWGVTAVDYPVCVSTEYGCTIAS